MIPMSDDEARPSLLIVDDDMGFVRAAAEIARGMSYDVTVAGGVQQARARMSRCEFDLVLIDLSLPDGSGLELIEGCDAGRTRIVIATGHPTLDSTLVALRPPAFDYLVKPIHPVDYRRLLQVSISFTVGMSFDEIERRMLMKTLREFNGDKTRTARVLGVSVKTIYNRLARYQQREGSPAGSPARADYGDRTTSGEHD